ncbi:HIT domain-containing protein [Pedobacter sp. ASV28]|uniref:HIT family protein n=1 Tax=Pedobacter sp. ASV28 TaxID=2795123 RepID=UPI0018EC50A0|nr:HIT domain-containing protein [Pedobacter sp. ASV28]
MAERYIIYSPLRKEYGTDGCFLCDISLHPENDTENYVIYRDERCFILMNRYPYSPGHFMIVPHSHTSMVYELDPAVWLHIAPLISNGIELLQKGFGAQGVNMGINQGNASGVGLSSHLHLHFVPRWKNDTNFMTTVANVRVFSSDFKKIFMEMKKLAKQYFKNQNKK